MKKLNKKQKQRTWLVVTVILVLATAIDIIIPDPILFIDEILLVFLSIFGAYQTIRKRGKKK